MDLQELATAVDAKARALDAAAADRVLLVYIAPGDAGLYVFRPGCGLHRLGGDGDGSSFGEALRGAVEKLWPESTKKTRQWLRIAADFLAHSPIARKLGAGGPTDDDD